MKATCTPLGVSPNYLKALEFGYSSVVQPGSLWQHVSGKKYRVVCVSICECDITPQVVYSCAEHGTIWCRPLREWLELVSYNSKPSQQRYLPVSDVPLPDPEPVVAAVLPAKKPAKKTA